jgi:hypothetical protein
MKPMTRQQAELALRIRLLAELIEHRSGQPISQDLLAQACYQITPETFETLKRAGIDRGAPPEVFDDLDRAASEALEKLEAVYDRIDAVRDNPKSKAC